MSINTAVNTGTRNGRRDIPVIYSLPQTESVATYTRPADWLTMPTVLSTDQKVVLLVGVENVSTNFFAVTCTTSASTYTVNWGDGTPDSVVTSGVSAYHNFNWNDVSSGTLTSRGYRQAIVTITPTTGNLLTCLFNPTYVGTGLIGSLSTGWNNKILESIVAGSNLTQILFGSGTQQSTWMEQSTVLSLSSTCNLQTFYSGCRSLQKVVSFPNGSYTNMTNMFSGCVNLQVAPLFSWGTISVNISSMFNGCTSLVSVPAYDTSNVTNMSQMFSGCNALNNIPLFNTINVTSMNSMFASCFALTSVPQFNTVNVTDMGSMFSACRSLKTCPTFNTIKVITTATMFQDCPALIQSPPFNLVACTTTVSMFNACFSLETVPAYNLPVVTTMATMFLNCYSLVNIGTLTTSTLLTNMSQTFTQCRSLINAPIVTNTTNVINMAELFFNCHSLQSVPVYDTANVTTLNGMFGFTFSLKTAPAINTIRSTNWQGLFSASGITEAPAYDSSNVTNMNTAFYQARSLITIPTTYDTRKVTNMNAMFQETNSLIEIPYMNTVNVTNFTNFAINSGVRRLPANIDTSNATAIVSMFSSCANLSLIPTLECNKVTTAGTAFSSSAGLTKITTANLKATTSVAGDYLGEAELEGFMQGLGTISGAAQTLTVSANPGADTALTKTATWTNSSNVMTMANTVGVVVGTQVTSASVNVGYSTTAYANNKVSLAVPLDANTMISFVSVTTSNLAANTLYYTSNVSNVGGTYYYDLSTTPGGTPITFTAGSSANTRVNVLVTAVNTNANVILNAWPKDNGTGASVTTRQLNTNIASYKNWTISG
mgnify:CR=1 FL=1